MKYILKSILLTLLPLLLEASPVVAQSHPQSPAGTLERDAQRIVDLLGSYIGLIVKHREDSELRSKYRRLALKLFSSPDAVVEVSSLKGPNPEHYAASDYLDHLIELGDKYGYTEIQLRWEPAEKSAHHNDPGGLDNFTVRQSFSGTHADPARTYRDVTDKQVAIAHISINLAPGVHDGQAVQLKVASVRVINTYSATPVQ